MMGDRDAIKYARRDLATLKEARRLTPGRLVAVQAGGNVGVFAKELARHYDAVYTFEPDPLIFRKLVFNVSERNVIFMQAALGHDRNFVKTTRARRHKVHLPPHDGVTHVSGPGVVPTVRVDDLGLPACDLLVLDTEGSELNCLRGAASTVERCRPVVMVEINNNCEFEGIRPDDVRHWLMTADYTFVSRIHSDEIWVPRR